MERATPGRSVGKIQPTVVHTSVVIVSYRTPMLTLAAAASALAVPSVTEVIVVDNASADATADLLRAQGDMRLRLVENANNVGYGPAANEGARQAGGVVLVFLNSDAEISTEAATALVDEVTRYRGRCLAGPRLVEADGTVQRSAGLLPTPFDLAIRGLGLNHVAQAARRWPIAGALVRRGRLAVEYDSAVEAVEPIDTTMVSGACWAISREVFWELGGFDERFFLYFEDADLCRRAARAGVAIRYLPSATVRHVGGASSAEDYHFGEHHARSMRQYLTKWYGPLGSGGALLILWLRAIGLTIGLHSGAGRAWRSLVAASKVGRY